MIGCSIARGQECIARFVVAACAAAIGVLFAAAPAAAERALPSIPVESGQIRVDGALGEWRGQRFVAVGDDDASAFEVLFAHDADALYVGARVFDDRLVRTSRPGRKDDALVVSLALPGAGGRYRSSELWLHPGEMGKRAAVARLGRRNLAQVKVVEGPLGDGEAGYVLEARIPWRALPGGRDWHLCRAAVRLHDVDGAAAARGPATVGAGARGLPPVRFIGGASDAFAAFRNNRGLPGATPRFDRVADVSGDARQERVVVVGTYVVVLGQGGDFRFVEAPVVGGADVRKARIARVTGERHPQLLLTLRQRNDQGSRELLQVWGFGTGEPRVRFQAELRKQTSEGWVDNRFELKQGRGGQPAELVFRLGESQGLGPDNYRERPAAGMASILLPWGPVEERVYRFDGETFAVVSEQANPAARTVEADKPVVRAASRPAQTPRRPSGAPRLLAAIKKAMGMPANTRARFLRHVNVIGDPKPDLLVVLGTELVVSAPDGSGFMFVTLPAAAPEHVQRVFTGDVTGDGRRDLFVRIKQMVGDVQRELLFAYTVAGRHVLPLAQIEVRRAQDDCSVGNVVKLTPEAGHYALEIAPGVARGWDAGSYPFQPGSQDGYLPLLLPWSDDTVRYAFRGDQLEPRK